MTSADRSKNRLLEQMADEFGLPGETTRTPTSINRRLLAQTAEEERKRKELEELAEARAAVIRRERELVLQARIERKKTIRLGGITAAVAIAVLWPASVIYAHKSLEAQALSAEKRSKAAMYCVVGEAVSDGDGIWGWLTSEPRFTCRQWRTTEQRDDDESREQERLFKQRERTRAGLDS